MNTTLNFVGLLYGWVYDYWLQDYNYWIMVQMQWLTYYYHCVVSKVDEKGLKDGLDSDNKLWYHVFVLYIQMKHDVASV